MRPTPINLYGLYVLSHISSISMFLRHFLKLKYNYIPQYKPCALRILPAICHRNYPFCDNANIMEFSRPTVFIAKFIFSNFLCSYPW